MKTILRIIAVLFVASVVAGAFFLAVNNNSTTPSTSEVMAPPAIPNGQSVSQPMTRPEGGDRDGGSLAGGLAGILGTLAKITGITILVIVVEKGLRQLDRFKLKSAQQ